MKEKLVVKNHAFEGHVISLLLLAVIVFLISCALLYLKRDAEDTYADKLAEKERLIRLKAEEEERTLAIEERQAYVQTRSYLEDVAREVLGLVYKDEIIFRPSTDLTPTPTPTEAPGN